MQTLVRKDNNVSIYLFDDSETINLEPNCILVGDPLRLTIADRNENDTILYQSIDAPEDWEGWKYVYTKENGWILNTN